MDTPLGAILAGGASRRMGADKALVELEGRPLVLHVAAALKRITPHVLVIGRDTPIAGLPTVPDRTTGRRGPLAGLDTALHEAGGEAVLLVATDQPFLRSETLGALLDIAGDAVVPLDAGVPQATCGLYRPGVAEAARELLASGEGSLQRLLARIQTTLPQRETWSGWGEDGRSWFSVNTPADLDQGVERYRTTA